MFIQICLAEAFTKRVAHPPTLAIGSPLGRNRGVRDWRGVNCKLEGMVTGVCTVNWEGVGETGKQIHILRQGMITRKQG